eukprot:938782-Prymnesium_polylepis.1
MGNDVVCVPLRRTSLWMPSDLGRLFDFELGIWVRETDQAREATEQEICEARERETWRREAQGRETWRREAREREAREQEEERVSRLLAQERKQAEKQERLESIARIRDREAASAAAEHAALGVGDLVDDLRDR